MEIEPRIARFVRLLLRVAMVGLVCNDDATTAGIVSCDADGQIIRFRTGALIGDTIDLPRHLRDKRFGIVENGLLKVTGVRVQRGGLFGDCFNYMRMAMTD